MVVHITTGIVAFAFGEDPDSFANREIAWTAEDYARRVDGQHLPIYTQGKEFLQFDDSIFSVSRVGEEPGKPAPTLRIARFAVASAIQHGLHHLIIICAPPHRARCEADVKFALREKCNEGKITFSTYPFSDVPLHRWWDPASSQWWVRGPQRWRARELALSVLRRLRLYALVTDWRGH